MATTVLLVRHGHTPTTGVVMPGRAPGLHLSERGEAEATALVARLAPLEAEIAALVSSPIERARATLVPLAAALGRPVGDAAGLAELDVGDWTGQDLAALHATDGWRRMAADPGAFTFPGGESYAAAQARVLAALDELATRHPRALVVAATHADPVRLVLAAARGIPLSRLAAVPGPEPAGLVAVEAGGSLPVELPLTDVIGTTL